MNSPPQPSDQAKQDESLPPCTSVSDIDSPQKIWADYGKNITAALFGIIIVAAVVCIIMGISEWRTGSKALENGGATLNDLGNFGSYLEGTTASLWALAGFFIIAVTFVFQTMQFMEQRKQFKLQSDSLNRQNFEASFFQMLNLHNQIALSMQATQTQTGMLTGRDCFKKWYDDFRHFWYQSQFFESDDGNEQVVEKPKDGIESYEEYYYSVRQAQLGNYFRNLYHLVKFVHKAEALNQSDLEVEYRARRRYTSLVRATLSQYELALLFYNCASELGEEKFKPLVERYGLLKNFNPDSLLNTERSKPPFGPNGIYTDKART